MSPTMWVMAAASSIAIPLLLVPGLIGPGMIVMKMMGMTFGN